MGHSVVRTESQQNHFQSSEISPKRGTTFSRQRQFTSNKINELIHVRQRIVLKMGLTPSGGNAPWQVTPVVDGYSGKGDRVVDRVTQRGVVISDEDRMLLPPNDHNKQISLT